MCSNKRNLIFRFLVIITASVFLFFICSSCASPMPSQLPSVDKSGLRVYYIDVMQGDCIFIVLPKGNNFMIDLGNGTDRANENILKVLREEKVSKIDNLIISHPDQDHIGGAFEVLNGIEVTSVYAPHILDFTLFPKYKSVVDFLNEKGVNFNVSDSCKIIKGEDYALAFLTPTPIKQTDSAYLDLLSNTSPTSKQINNLSPIIYFEYSGVRFLFTGDAEIEQEELLLRNYYSLVYKNTFSVFGVNVVLEEIDFLKVSHHGSNDASGKVFLDLLKPNNAMISVDGDNIYGFPNSNVLKRIQNANPTCTFWRTDVYGTMVVNVMPNGFYKTLTQLDG